MFSYIKNGTITDVQGIFATGIHAGLRVYKKDLALIYSEEKCTAAGVFTQNSVKAAPVQINEETLVMQQGVRAILVNSKCANACTGKEGINAALEVREVLAKSLSVSPTEILLSSTGVIGTMLPKNKMIKALPTLTNTLSSDGGHSAAEAILTTDTKTKSFAVRVGLSTGEITLGAMCKGSGMIHPNMATMLGFIATDASIEHGMLQSLLTEAVNHSFNKITVDSDTSTNDMVLLLANGVSGIAIKEGSEDKDRLYEALLDLCQTMAKSIVADGEGAKKLVTVQVNLCTSEADANKIAEAIATSPLVKTAFHGEDPNWGRIIAAIGYSGVSVNAENICLYIGTHKIMDKGFSIHLNETIAKQILSEPEIILTVEMNTGTHSTTWWTCDFSKEYISINADYRS